MVRLPVLEWDLKTETFQNWPTLKNSLAIVNKKKLVENWLKPVFSSLHLQPMMWSVPWLLEAMMQPAPEKALRTSCWPEEQSHSPVQEKLNKTG